MYDENVPSDDGQESNDHWLVQECHSRSRGQRRGKISTVVCEPFICTMMMTLTLFRPNAQVKTEDGKIQPITRKVFSTAIRCAHKGNSGLLYPLEKSFFFIYKPATYVSFALIVCVCLCACI